MQTLTEIVAKAEMKDPSLESGTRQVLRCFSFLASKGRQQVDCLLRHGILNYLDTYLEPKFTTFMHLYYTNWLAANIISHGDDSITTQMVERELVPRLRFLYSEEEDEAYPIVRSVFSRLLRNRTFLQTYTGKWVTFYKFPLPNAKGRPLLLKLQQVLRDVLETIQKEDAEVKSSARHCKERAFKFVELVENYTTPLSAIKPPASVAQK